MAAINDLPNELAGYWGTDEGSGMAKHYLVDHPTRVSICGGQFTDMAVATSIALLARDDFYFEPQLAMARDRIRWLSAHLAAANMPRSRMEPVDLGYCLFCATRFVERDPMGWLHADKEPWIKMAANFMRLAELKP